MRHFVALCTIVGPGGNCDSGCKELQSHILLWTLPPADPASWHLWTLRLSALVTGNGCNSEDHSAASGADMDRSGTVLDRKNCTGTEW